MNSIVLNYEGVIHLNNKIIKFTSSTSLDSITIGNENIVLNKNSKRYGRYKFRNHIMEHVVNIIINSEYILRKCKFVNKIYSLFLIHSTWHNRELIEQSDNFIIENFNSNIYDTYKKLNSIYKKKYFILCYIYINGGFYIGNSCLKLNYPLEYFIKKRCVVVKNTLTNLIYDDFIYSEPGTAFLKNLIEEITESINNKTYDTVMGESIFMKVYKNTYKEELQTLILKSYLSTDLNRYCKYVWINDKGNHERYIDIEVSKYIKILKYHNEHFK